MEMHRTTIRTTDDLKNWFVKQNPSLILSLNSKCIETFQLKDTELLCRAVVKILPKDALLIAGDRDGFVNRLICEEMKHIKKLLQQQEVRYDDKDIGLTDRAAREPSNVLSMYHRWKNVLFEKWKNPLESCVDGHRARKGSLFRTPDFVELSKNPIKLSPASVFVVHLNLHTCNTFTENPNGYLELQVKGETEMIDKIVEKIDGRSNETILSDSNDSEKAELLCSTILSADGTHSEEQLCKLIRQAIFTFLIKGGVKDEEVKLKEEKLFKSFIDRWYDDELLKELLDQASQGKKPEFSFDSTVKEPWIDLLTQEDSEVSLKLNDLRDVEDSPSSEKFIGTTDSGFGPNLKYKILFIWCVQKGMKRKLYMKYWHKGKNQLAMALLAYKVSRDMSREHNGSEIADKMQTQMK